MSKQEFFEQLNAGACLTPCTADQVNWFYEWLNSPVRQKLPHLARMQSKRDEAAMAMTAKLKLRGFFERNADDGKTDFKVRYQNNQMVIYGSETCLTVKL